MALIKTSAELKANLSSVDGQYNLNALSSFINEVEQNIIATRIGRDTLSEVVADYVAGNIAGPRADLLKILQAAVTHLAFLLAADSGSIRLSDAGFYVEVTEKMKPVSDKKMTQFYRGRREMGYKALERAVIYLEAHIDDPDFASYKASDHHQENSAYFINNSEELTRYYKKADNSAYLYNRLTDVLDRTERKYIKPVLGNAFFRSLKDKIRDKSLTSQERSLLPYINRALANFTMADALADLPVEIEGTSLLISSSPAYGNSENVVSKSAANTMQISSLVSSAKRAGQDELDELEEYLLDHALDFQAYIVPEAGEDFNINDTNEPNYFV